MKKVRYIIAVIWGLAAVGAFMESLWAGILMLLATFLICPYTSDRITQKVNGILEKSNFKVRIGGWFYVFLFLIFTYMATSVPLSVESDTKTNYVVEHTSKSGYKQRSAVTEMTSTQMVNEKIPKADLEIVTVTPKPTMQPVTVESIETKEDVVSEQEIIEEGKSNLEVHFIDVGQGDATLVKADNHYMLIDAADNNKGTAVQLYLTKQGVEKLDYLILTHTDADHIGGADVIVSKYDIDTVFLGDFKKDNKTYEELMNALEYKGLTYSIPEVGSEYALGNATFIIVAPNRTYSDPNNSSISLVLKNGENSFLFTGDCEQEAELDILSNGLDIDCDVYKAGHHGSRTSSSLDFLDAITPKYSVFSCAENNSYGHPHAETLNNLRMRDVQIFRTDEQGSIIAYSNGKEITWNSAPSNTWQAGEGAVVMAESTPEPTPEPTPIPTLEPMLEPTPELEQPATVDVMVWISATGSKYHSINNCGRMNPNKAFQMTESAAQAQYGRCSKCW